MDLQKLHDDARAQQHAHAGDPIAHNLAVIAEQAEEAIQRRGGEVVLPEPFDLRAGHEDLHARLALLEGGGALVPAADVSQEIKALDVRVAEMEGRWKGMIAGGFWKFVVGLVRKTL